jgi:hypothetical protein
MTALFTVVLRALERVDGCCLDTDAERERVARCLVKALREEIKIRVDDRVRRTLARTFSKQFFDGIAP